MKNIKSNLDLANEFAPQYKYIDLFCIFSERNFDNAKQVFSHVCKTHVVPDGICLWENCDKMPRKKWALITHFQVKCPTSVSQYISTQLGRQLLMVQ